MTLLHMARARPSAPSSRFRRRSGFWCRLRATQPRRPRRRSKSRSGGLDIIPQRFLLGLVFLDPALDDIADRDQADYPALLDHRQVPELAQRHHFHNAGDGVGLPATDDFAGHHRADGFVEYAGATLAQRAYDIALGQDAFDAALAHHQHRADLSFAENLDRRRELGVRLDAQDLVAFGIEN